MAITVLWIIVFVTLCVPKVQGAYRYNLESCSDLVPRHVPDRQENYQVYEIEQSTPSWRGRSNSGGGSIRRTKREIYSRDNYDSPFRITVPGKRYRREDDLYVQVEGTGYYDAMMLQGRAVSPTGDFIAGGVGLLGRFDLNKMDNNRNFSYLECFRQLQGTVVDNGYTRLGNATFVWNTPDADRGDIRFLAGITRGGHYWIIVSSILHFNPFPISVIQCGGAEACFRVCPLDVSDSFCASDNSVIMYNYNTDLIGKSEVEFTLGGKLSSSQTSYIAVVYAEDNDNLYRADVTACYLENGRAQIGHYLLEVVGAPLIEHNERINIDDYDYDGNMLWCRFRRPVNYASTAVINPRRSFFTLLYRGEINPHSYPKLQTPIRSNMYGSDRKLNLTTPINEVFSGTLQISCFVPTYLITLLLAFILVMSI